MREILFRGKRTDNGEWVYGSPIFQDGYVLIRFWNGEEFEFEEYLVSPESVSEFTGLTDKNNQKIFEGDTVKNSYGNIKVVEYYRGYYYPFVAFPEYTAWDEKECEVVGNAYDFLEASNKM